MTRGRGESADAFAAPPRFVLHAVAVLRWAGAAELTPELLRRARHGVRDAGVATALWRTLLIVVLQQLFAESDTGVDSPEHTFAEGTAVAAACAVLPSDAVPEAVAYFLRRWGYRRKALDACLRRKDIHEAREVLLALGWAMARCRVFGRYWQDHLMAADSAEIMCPLPQAATEWHEHVRAAWLAGDAQICTSAQHRRRIERETDSDSSGRAEATDAANALLETYSRLNGRLRELMNLERSHRTMCCRLGVLQERVLLLRAEDVSVGATGSGCVTVEGPGTGAANRWAGGSAAGGSSGGGGTSSTGWQPPRVSDLGPFELCLLSNPRRLEAYMTWLRACCDSLELYEASADLERRWWEWLERAAAAAADELGPAAPTDAVRGSSNGTAAPNARETKKAADTVWESQTMSAEPTAAAMTATAAAAAAAVAAVTPVAAAAAVSALQTLVLKQALAVTCCDRSYRRGHYPGSNDEPPVDVLGPPWNGRHTVAPNIKLAAALDMLEQELGLERRVSGGGDGGSGNGGGGSGGGGGGRDGHAARSRFSASFEEASAAAAKLRRRWSLGPSRWLRGGGGSAGDQEFADAGAALAEMGRVARLADQRRLSTDRIRRNLRAWGPYMRHTVHVATG
ncbi:unnamed protein product [Phaeothamnion confervicola]